MEIMETDVMCSEDVSALFECCPITNTLKRSLIKHYKMIPLEISHLFILPFFRHLVHALGHQLYTLYILYLSVLPCGNETQSGGGGGGKIVTNTCTSLCDSTCR